jgi:hypothetical protein
MKHLASAFRLATTPLFVAPGMAAIEDDTQRFEVNLEQADKKA